MILEAKDPLTLTAVRPNRLRTLRPQGPSFTWGELLLDGHGQIPRTCRSVNENRTLYRYEYLLSFAEFDRARSRLGRRFRTRTKRSGGGSHAAPVLPSPTAPHHHKLVHQLGWELFAQKDEGCTRRAGFAAGRVWIGPDAGSRRRPARWSVCRRTGTLTGRLWLDSGSRSFTDRRHLRALHLDRDLLNRVAHDIFMSGPEPHDGTEGGEGPGKSNARREVAPEEHRE